MPNCTIYLILEVLVPRAEWKKIPYYRKFSTVVNVVDPDRVESASFCPIRIDINSTHFFPENFIHAVQNTENYYTFDTNEKVKHFILNNGRSMTKREKKNSDIPTCVKLGVGSAWGSASFWCQSGSGSGSASNDVDPQYWQNGSYDKS